MPEKRIKKTNKTLQKFRIPGGFFTVLCLLLLTAACEEYAQDDYREYVVLEAYAVANRPLPEVRLSTALPTDQAYHFSDAALDGANIQITLLDNDGAGGDVFGYIPASEKGVYIPESPAHRVLAGRTYRIDIDFNNRPEIIRAQTTIPDDFEIISDIPDRIVYQSPNQLELVVSATETTRDPHVFVFNAIAQNPVLENLAPFWKELVEEDDDTQVEDFYMHDSGLINEGNFDVNPDGTITIQYPWIGIAFFEENLFAINSVDKNLSELVSSQEVQLGGSTLSPGEIPNLRYNVEGGIGIFGGIASDTVQTYVERPEGL